MKRKICIVCLLAVLLILAAGCGKDKNGSAQQTISSKDYVYKVTPLELEGWDTGNYSGVMKNGDVVYAYGYEYGEDGEKVHVASLDQNDSIKEEGIISFAENESLSRMECDRQGFIYAVKNIYAAESEEEGDYRDYYYLVKLTLTGEEIFSIFLNEMPQVQELTDESGWFYTGDINILEDSLYLNIMGNYLEFDLDGNFRKIIKGNDENSLDGVSIYPLSNGMIAGLTYEDDGCYIGYVDMETGNFIDKQKLPGNSYDYTVYAGDSVYELYLVNSYGVYGYNIGDTDKTQLMNFIDSDLGVYSIYNVISINDREFFGLYDDMETYENKIGRFSKVDPEDVKDKKTIVLACAGMDWDIRTNVVKFNKSNEEYRITIQDYYALYGTDTDYMAGINRLNADIVSGKVPDILLLSSDMPVESYISKGLFEDLKPYIDKDAELDINNYMPNIIEAYSVDGKLYQLVPYYTISTMLAKTSDVGEERGWTVQDANDLINSKPEGTQLVTYVDRNTMLIRCMSMAGNQFVDWETGKCSFNSEGFIEMLEFIKQFPEKVDEAVYTDDYWNNYDSMWREGKVIAQISTVASFRDYNYTEKGTFGETVTMIGFPSGNKDGSAIMPGRQLVMSSKSTGKEGAWQFLRYYLTDEYQNEIEYGFPLSIERMEALAEEAMKNPVYIDENGNEIETQDYFYMNGVEIPIKPMTKEEVERFKENLYSFTQVYNYDEDLIRIIQEETAAFFGGQKNAKDVAEIVQSRAQIYVNENR